MLNDNKIEVHLHLWYEKSSIYLLKKISKQWNGRINISLIEDAQSNKEILNCANDLFAEVQTVYCENKGSDQSGFYESLKANNESKEWVFYAHDKSEDKIPWLDQIVDPILQSSKINACIEEENVGIISSGNPKRLSSLLTEEYLVKLDKQTKKKDKLAIVLSRQTLVWLRELQYILYDTHGLIDKENLNFKFTAGTMFLIRSNVLKITHDCIHQDFFPSCYRVDGDVTHALERFYYYVSICLGLQNYFVQEV